ncbi:Leucine-rich repeat-containing protein 23 [Trichoplax sp. H2]|uniref:U2A'/phosphoprotein 32 family A C-terminal domain-containing protein n=1 Tax=Trichoplax adhaerens TaxID=10228 RepID=B3S062_TRIAD|nr:hypothetical protein TRIADDRAFT_57697 [Trichoplax adhaerens]EDV23950.1 hypothetical protein TRIADDRAFT_57697 [Trichoplax adhaerens]RDD44190.1 Leucine-rich repeat-containing protein 23 [Trichoplax sp. H2]|eukprot:XP_002113476.1 hypothetical protein TRIADDRAFT_57697 [Trichoplax adhaerens]
MSDYSDYDGEDDNIDIDNDIIEQDGEDNLENVTENSLNDENIREGLSLLCKTGNGISHAYVRLDVHDKNLTDINKISNFIHLRYLDISGNNLKDISPLNHLTHLLTLKADRNLLTSARLEELPYLQSASFAHNAITSTEGISHPLLESLILSFNNIVDVRGLDQQKLAKLQTLELRANKLTSVEHLTLPKLKNLYLAANLIDNLNGIDKLVQLRTLHMRDNAIKSLDGFTDNMKHLQYINLRGTNIDDIKEVSKLKCLPLLRAVVLSESPVADENDYRIEILIALRRLERLDKEEYNEDERQEAEEINEQRRQEEQLQKGAEEVIQSDEES